MNSQSFHIYSGIFVSYYQTEKTTENIITNKTKQNQTKLQQHCDNSIEVSPCLLFGNVNSTVLVLRIENTTGRFDHKTQGKRAMSRAIYPT